MSFARSWGTRARPLTISRAVVGSREGKLLTVALSATDVYVQAAIAVLVISNPADPIKIMIFNSVIAERGLSRRAAALRVSLIVLAVLAVTALVGRELLQLIGINLGAFGVVGGLVVAGMGFEMLAGGGSSRVQGTKDAGGGADQPDGLVMPLATPLMAGPGTITTVITVSSLQGGKIGVIAALVAVAIAAVAVFLSFAYLGKAFDKLKPSAAAMLARIGGLLLATIGSQMVLSGIRTFYGF